MTTQEGKAFFVLVGTYTTKGSEGIYVYRFDASSGALEPVSKATGIANPSYQEIHPSRRFLYSVSEVRQAGQRSGGAVKAYAINPKTGELTFLNQAFSQGVGPCHVTVDRSGKFALAANYSSGSAAIFPIREDGSVDEASDVVQHRGSGANPKRQEGPHAHSINVDPANRFAFVADLGLDKVMIYRLDLAKGKLIPNDPPWAQTQPGAGPRHFAFHPSRRFAYVINELDNTLISFAYDEQRGALTTLQTLPTLPDDFKGTSYCADVHVHPSGRFVYGTNRGHDSLAIFEVDGDSGQLTFVAHEPTRGKHPRNFVIDPTATFLLVANQDTDNIVTYRIDQESGRLVLTGPETRLSMPVCLKMIPCAG